MELRYDGERAVALLERRTIGHAHLHGVQVDRTMAVGNTFRVTGGAGGVTHRGGRTLVDLGPVEVDGLLGDQRFVRMNLHAVGSVDAVGGLARHDDVLDGGQLRQLRVEQRQQ